MEDLIDFFNFKSSVRSQIRGNVTMYDVKGHYKWLNASELFDYWLKINKRGMDTNI